MIPASLGLDPGWTGEAAGGAAGGHGPRVPEVAPQGSSNPAPGREFGKMSSSCSASFHKFLERARGSGWPGEGSAAPCALAQRWASSGGCGLSGPSCGWVPAGLRVTLWGNRSAFAAGSSGAALRAAPRAALLSVWAAGC